MPKLVSPCPDAAPVDADSIPMITFLAELDRRSIAYAEARGPNYPVSKHTVDKGGRKYLRIVTSYVDGGHASVLCFIEKSTGEVIRADGWKAISARSYGRMGNLNDEKNGLGRFSDFPQLSYL